MFGRLWKDCVELLVLFLDALGMLMHGNFLGEDNEESPLCRGEKLRFEQASLSLALHCFGSVPSFHMAWQHQCPLAFLNCIFFDTVLRETHFLCL